jgi:hypothetical protein
MIGDPITAREQFQRDFILITDNDQGLYEKAMELARASWEELTCGGEEPAHKSHQIVKLARLLEEDYHRYVQNVVEREKHRGNESGSLLLQQLLAAWGLDTWYGIAEHYYENAEPFTAIGIPVGGTDA